MPELTLSKSVLLTDLALCINRYRLVTPGIYVCIHVPVVLNDGTKFVPGLVAQVNHGRLKQCEPSEEGFMGPPNFVLDVFDSSELDELESRKAVFEKFGVIEYVAVISDAKNECRWHRHSGTKFEKVGPDDDGIVKSLALPGLWFATYPLEDREAWSLGDMLDRGMSRLGHHEFMETIWHKNGRDPDWGDWLPFESG